MDAKTIEWYEARFIEMREQRDAERARAERLAGALRQIDAMCEAAHGLIPAVAMLHNPFATEVHSAITDIEQVAEDALARKALDGGE